DALVRATRVHALLLGAVVALDVGQCSGVFAEVLLLLAAVGTPVSAVEERSTLADALVRAHRGRSRRQRWEPQRREPVRSLPQRAVQPLLALAAEREQGLGVEARIRGVAEYVDLLAHCQRRRLDALGEQQLAVLGDPEYAVARLERDAHR